MELKKIIEGLNRLERQILPILEKSDSIHIIEKETGLKEVEIVRTFQWLQNKKLITTKEDQKQVVHIDKNGKKYLKEGLPEKRLLKALQRGPITIDRIKDRAGVSKEEQNIAVGVLRKKAAIFITKEGKDIVLKILPQGKNLIEQGLGEEKLLQKEFPIDVHTLSTNEKAAVNELKKRKEIIKVSTEKTKKAELTELGEELLKSGIEITDSFDRLTPEMLRTSSWKPKKFRPYDIKINVPKIHAVRKQPYRQFIDGVKQKFLALGFQEKSGPLVETALWNMDALYMPQFHSARGIHDAFYIKEPPYGKVDDKIVKKVKQAHENGLNTGSSGWGYKFDEKESHRLLLRTHDTSISPQTLASPSLKIPGKYFQIVRCFRPDVIDASHNVDFNQAGGFIIDENITFRHLKGLLKMFAEEFCQTDQIKVVPGYFPFTEPSAELHVKHPQLGWIELAGSGVFRPEVVKPLVGREVPCIAWGLGLDRIAMISMGISDIRQLFSHDLEVLRNQKCQQ